MNTTLINGFYVLFGLFLLVGWPGYAADQVDDRILLDQSRLATVKNLSKVYCPRSFASAQQLNVMNLPRCHKVMGDRECRMYRLLNAFRYYCGKKQLKASRSATLVAREHSQYMARTNNFRHSNRSSRIKKIRQYGGKYRTTGENIAMQWTGYGTMRALRKLIQSPGHRKNILSNMYSAVGIGKGLQQHRYFTQIFCVN